MKILGLDLGSRQVKLALMDEGQIVYKKSWHTATFYRQFCGPSGNTAGTSIGGNLGNNKELGIDLSALGIEMPDVCVSTGYGRNNTQLKGFQPINELKAHSFGAQHQTGETDFVLLDVGGQDVKVMRVEKGQLVDMTLNDKCAASCGRFLEQMAEILDMPLDIMTKHVLEPVSLSSTCAVFCESELIGKMAEGCTPEALAAGVNWSLFKRLEPMLSGFEHSKLLLSGGVAVSQALKNQLETKYEIVQPLADPTYNGAIGCCAFGLKAFKGRETHV